MCEDAIVRMTVAASGTPLGAVLRFGWGCSGIRMICVRMFFYGDGATGVEYVNDTALSIDEVTGNALEVA